jgi:Calcineurin-like phosphoesterase/Purple acid Phosphatase, N-terminal domain
VDPAIDAADNDVQAPRALLHMPIRTRLLAIASILVVGMSLVAVGLGAQTPALTRGPYLQLGTPTSIVVRWRTATPTDSVVRYGTLPGALAHVTVSAGATTEHVATLAGLTPHTRYFYAVGSSAATLAGGDLGHSFVTAPRPGARATTRIWVLGDSGTADGNARAVRDAATAFNHWREPDLWMMLGDNAYTSGTDAEYQAAVFDTYPETLRRAVLWPTFGNHDAEAADSATQSGPYYDIFTLPTAGEAGGVPSGTEAYYSFDYGNVHVVCLDSTESDRSAHGPMVRWLEADLAATPAEWTIAFFHHPPYSKGSHDSDDETELRQMREQVGPVLEAGGVDLVLAGHSHSYERSYWLNGHFGPSSTLSPGHLVDGGNGYERVDGAYRKLAGRGRQGTLYVTLGSSGQVTPAPLNHPAMRVSRATWGSMVLDVDGPRMSVAFVTSDSSGDALDTVTLLKHAPDGAPEAPEQLSAFVSSGQVRLTWRDTGGGRPDDYELEAGTGPGRTDIGRLGTGALRTEFRSPVGPGRYTVRVRARNAVGVSDPSSDVEFSMDSQGQSVLPPPLVRTSTQFGSTVSIAVLPVTGLGTSSGALLEAGSAPRRSDVGSVRLHDAGFFASGVPPGVYYARFRSWNLAGLGPPSRELRFVVGGLPVAPGAPGQPRAAVSGRDVALTWPPPPRDTPPARYVVEAGTRPGAVDVRIPTPDASPSIAFASVPRGTYYVRVRAENALGVGLPSDEVRLRVP